MSRWYRHSKNITIKDGTEAKEYTYVFETIDKELAFKVEKYLQGIIDEINKKIEGEGNE